MRKSSVKLKRLALVIMALLLLAAGRAHAAIDGVTGTTFDLTAKAGYISTPDGNSIYMWGYALENDDMQYPGPTLIVNAGATVTVNLTNQLAVPVSIVFPGQGKVATVGGTGGYITQEAKPGGGVSYTFKAERPGTYLYYSGTRPDLQTEMGLVGALIVRPAGFTDRAYDHPDTRFDHEYLFLLSELDLKIHQLAATGNIDAVDMSTYWPVYWFINGRAAPDTMAPATASWLPNQPYNSMPMMLPGETILLRLIGAGRDMHPFHTHGNHTKVIARDGRLLESAPGAGSDLAEFTFTNTIAPGQTLDALFTWTGEKLGWDMYGHTDPTDSGKTGAECTAGLEPGEYLEDHCKPFPVILPGQQDLTFGAWYSGSPFLGAAGALPPGEGGLNPNSGFFFMWHSHNEKEITNNDIFPGGMLTMMVVEHPSVMLMNP
jgi:FtsP/CotA-like multicopper oxidase with cupredoxin domain